MFRPNDKCYVKTSSGYVLCTIIKKQDSYYLVRTESAAFGATEHRLITIEEYEKNFSLQHKQTYYRPPDPH